MQAAHKIAFASQNLEHASADAGHDVHTGHNVRGVGEFDADIRNRRADGAHAVRDDIHDAARHRTREQPLQL